MKYQKTYQLVIVFLLLAGSVIAMMVLKSRWETTRVLAQDDTVIKTYFWLSITVFLCTVGYLMTSWIFGRWKEYRELKNERIEAELSILKSKIDPHFFFNTLNNLYGLACEKSEKTPQVILELSEIMRYVIYEGEKERVPLSTEIDYLQKYIKLHQIRYQDATKLQLQATVDNHEVEIAPLLLVTLIENGIKHGLELVSENPYLLASLSTVGGKMIFEVKNRYVGSEQQPNGLGLQTLKRRLELIYPKKHIFTTARTKDEFQARLEIDLI